jgi:DEAD/DEAH box helicase domain-containing protein
MNLAGWEKLGGRYIMCNQSDLGCDCANPHDTRYYPERLLVFDKHPGGIGIAAQACPMFAELLQAALEQLIACDCTTETGCPACVQV